MSAYIVAYKLQRRLLRKRTFLPRDASAEHGYEVMRLLSSVCLSDRNDQVPCSNTLEFFENNFTAK